jgi:hypothetical protein
MTRKRIGGEDAAAVSRSLDRLLATRPDLPLFGDLRGADDLSGFGPFFRALMRLESRRLQDDAATFPHALGSRRGPVDRQMLALCDLLEAVDRLCGLPAVLDRRPSRDAS